MSSWFAPPVVIPIAPAKALEPAHSPDRLTLARARGWMHGCQTWLTLNATELTWTALLIGLLLFVELFTAR
jgi:hypothetical protein